MEVSMKKGYMLFGGLLIVLGMMFSPVTALAASHKPDKSTNNPPVTLPSVAVQNQQNAQAKQQDAQQNGKGNHGSNAPEHGAVQVYKGTLTGPITDTSITVTLADGTPQPITVGTNTQVKIPTMKGATLTDLVEGETVVVQVRSDVAVRILLVPGKPTLTHRVGTVTAYSPASGDTPGSITIKAVDDVEYTFVVTDTTKFLPAGVEPKVDDVVTIIAPRNPATPTAPLTATGIVIHGAPDTETTESGD
jgi:hypothetical protein